MKLDFEDREDHYTFLDASELRSRVEAITAAGQFHDLGRFQRRDSWLGNVTYGEALRAITLGDESLVADSDKLLSELEDKLPHTKKFQIQRGIAGGAVDVPQFLSGRPDCMRRRVRLDRNDAPVTIFMDLTSSGMISASALLKRGTTILALARALCEHRTVELWGGVSLGGGTGYAGGKAWSSTVAWRIDTAPLVLAHAAFLLSSPAIARGVGYGIGPACAGRSWSGSWSFANHDLHVRTQTERLRNAMGASEMLVIPPIYGTDPLVSAPLEWITRELTRLTTGDAPGSEDWNRERNHAH